MRTARPHCSATLHLVHRRIVKDCAYGITSLVSGLVVVILVSGGICWRWPKRTLERGTGSCDATA